LKRKDVPQVGNLRDVNVLTCVNFIAGPFISGLLAEMGARVTSIERPSTPDGIRNMPEWFAMEHRNQLNLAMDMNLPKGREIFAKLVKENDIFVENAKSGSLAKLGVTDEYLWSLNPAMVIVHVSGFGQAGDPDYLGRPSLDAIGQAFSGYMNFNGPEETPMVARLYTADYVSALFGTVGALAALHRARITGKGESVDVAMYESMLRISADAVALGLNRGVVPTRLGNRTQRAYGEGIYKCMDGEYVFWMSGQVGMTVRGTLKVLGFEGDDLDPGPGIGFSTKPELAEKVEKRMKLYCDTHSAKEVSDTCKEQGAIASYLMTYPMMEENAQYKARKSIIEWDDPYMNERIKGVRPSPLFKNNPSEIWRGTPSFGMDNDDLMEELGYTKEQIAELYELGILSKKAVL